MNKTVKKIVVVVLVLFIGWRVYAMFFSKGSADTEKNQTTTLKNSVNTSSSTSVNTDKFLNLLLGINTIKLSTSIFQRPDYLSLIDFSLKEEDQKLDLSFGRKNPFLPIGQDTDTGTSGDQLLQDDVSSGTVTTLTTSTITASTAIVNGVSDISGDVLDQYFEWGIVKELPLGNTTASIKRVGNKKDFSYTLTNLLPDTTYYVRAVVKTTQKIIVGDIVSFKTSKK